MEAEIIVMEQFCRHLFSIINIATSLGKTVSMPMGEKMINVYVQENIQVLWHWLELC